MKQPKAAWSMQDRPPLLCCGGGSASAITAGELIEECRPKGVVGPLTVLVLRRFNSMEYLETQFAPRKATGRIGYLKNMNWFFACTYFGGDSMGRIGMHFQQARNGNKGFTLGEAADTEHWYVIFMRSEDEDYDGFHCKTSLWDMPNPTRGFGLNPKLDHRWGSVRR